MSGRKPKKNQRLGSSRRGPKGLNRNIEKDDDNDDGLIAESQHGQTEFHTTTETTHFGHPSSSTTDQQTSASECAQHAASHNDLIIDTEPLERKRKMGSTRKGGGFKVDRKLEEFVEDYVTQQVTLNTEKQHGSLIEQSKSSSFQPESSEAVCQIPKCNSSTVSLAANKLLQDDSVMFDEPKTNQEAPLASNSGQKRRMGSVRRPLAGRNVGMQEHLRSMSENEMKEEVTDEAKSEVIAQTQDDVARDPSSHAEIGLVLNQSLLAEKVEVKDPDISAGTETMTQLSVAFPLVDQEKPLHETSSQQKPSVLREELDLMFGSRAEQSDVQNKVLEEAGCHVSDNSQHVPDTQNDISTSYECRDVNSEEAKEESLNQKEELFRKHQASGVSQRQDAQLEELKIYDEKLPSVNQHDDSATLDNICEHSTGQLVVGGSTNLDVPISNINFAEPKTISSPHEMSDAGAELKEEYNVCDVASVTHDTELKCFTEKYKELALYVTDENESMNDKRGSEAFEMTEQGDVIDHNVTQDMELIGNEEYMETSIETPGDDARNVPEKVKVKDDREAVNMAIKDVGSKSEEIFRNLPTDVSLQPQRPSDRDDHGFGGSVYEECEKEGNLFRAKPENLSDGSEKMDATSDSGEIYTVPDESAISVLDYSAFNLVGNVRDVAIVPLGGDTDLEIQTEGQHVDYSISEVGDTYENIRNIGALVKEVEAHGDTVENTMITESDIQTSDVNAKALKVFENPQKEDSSGACLISDGIHKEKADSKSSPTVQRRKIGSTRRPLKGNKEQRKGREFDDANEKLDNKEMISVLKEIISLEDGVCADESTLESTLDEAEEPEMEICVKYDAVVEESALIQSSYGSDLVSEESTALSVCNTTEAQTLTQSHEESQDNAGDVEIEAVVGETVSTSKGEGTEENIQDVKVLVREAEVIGGSVDCNVTAESDVIQNHTLANAKLETLQVSENTEDVAAVTDSDLLVQHEATEGAEKTHLTPEQSGISVIPGDYHKKEANLKSSPVVQKRKMGSTRRPLKGNKGQRKGRDLHDENETFNSEFLLDVEKETFGLENKPCPDESALQNIKDGAEEQEKEICVKNDVGLVEESESALIQSSYDSDLVSEESTALSVCNITESQTLTEIQKESLENADGEPVDGDIKPQRIGQEHPDENDTVDSKYKISVETPIFSLDDQPNPDEFTLQNIKDRAEEQEKEVCVKNDAGLVKESESDLIQSSYSSELSSEKSTALSVCHITESHSFTKIQEGSWEIVGDVERESVDGGTNLQLESESQNQTCDSTSKAEENIHDVNVLAREAMVIEESVKVDSNVTAESDVLQKDTLADAKLETSQISNNSDDVSAVTDTDLLIQHEATEGLGETDTIAEKSGISIIPGDSHRGEANSKSSPVVQRRKTSSTRRPLKGNKGQRKGRELQDENETFNNEIMLDLEKEIFSLENEPCPDESTLESIKDELLVEESESALNQSSYNSDSVSKDSTALSVCNIKESQTLAKVQEESQYNAGDVKRVAADGDTDLQLETESQNHTFNSTIKEENIHAVNVLVREAEVIEESVKVDCNVTAESDVLQNEFFADAQLETLQVSEDTEDIFTVADSDLLVQHEATEEAGETNSIPKQSGISISPGDSHREEENSKSSLVVPRRKMGSTRRPLKENKGQRKGRELHDENETFSSEIMLNVEKETFMLDNERCPDESTLQNIKDGAEEQETEMCVKNDAGVIEESESALIQSSYGSDLVSEESTALRICNITESQTLTEIQEESQENADGEPVDGDIKPQRTGQEYPDENDTDDSKNMIKVETPIFSLDDQPNPDEFTLESSINGAEAHKINMFIKNVVGLVEESESAFIQLSNVSDLGPEESTALTVCNITESQTLTNIPEESLEIFGDVEREAVDGDTDLQLQTEPHNQTFASSSKAEENIHDGNVLVREADVIGESVKVDSNVTAESDVLQKDTLADAKLEIFQQFENTDVSAVTDSDLQVQQEAMEEAGETNSIPEQSRINVIPSPVVQRRKIGSTRRPLKGNNVTAVSDVLQKATLADAKWEKDNVSENTESLSAVTDSDLLLQHHGTEGAGETDSNTKQSGISIIPGDLQRKETNLESSPVVQRRKMGSTRRPLKGNKGQRKGRELHDENETFNREFLLDVQKETFGLEDEPGPDESTLQNIKDGAEEQEKELCVKNDAGLVGESESALIQSSYGSDLASGETTALSVCNITEPQTLTKTHEEAWEIVGDVERATVEEDTDLQSKTESQNQTCVSTSEAEENIHDVNVLVREAEVTGESVILDSNVTAESDVIQKDTLADAELETLQVSENTEDVSAVTDTDFLVQHLGTERAEGTDTISVQSGINIIPRESHGEEANSKSSPVVQRRKMGSTRRPLKGNKGQRKGQELDDEKETFHCEFLLDVEKETFSLENEPCPDESTLQNMKDGAEEQEKEICLENDVGLVEESESALIQSYSSDLVSEESTALSVCNITESQTLTKIQEESWEIVGDVERESVDGDTDLQLETESQNQTCDSTSKAEQNIHDVNVLVREAEGIGESVTVDSNVTAESDVLQKATLADPKLETLHVSENTKDVSAVTDSDLLVQHEPTVEAGETDTVPEKSGISIIPGDSHNEEANSKSSPVVQRRKMGSTRRPLKGNKGQRKGRELQDENETLNNEIRFDVEKETFGLENEPCPDESALQNIKVGAEEQEKEICVKNDAGVVEEYESDLIQSFYGSDLVSEESTALSVCHIKEAQTLTISHEQFQNNPGDAERAAVVEDAADTEDTSETEATVTMKSTTNTASHVFQTSPSSSTDAFNISTNVEEDTSGDTDTIFKQSNINVVHEDIYRGEAHPKLSPVVQKRKMGSTRRPLRGNKGQRKDNDEKEISFLENEPNPDELIYTAMGISDISEAQTHVKVHEESQDNHEVVEKATVGESTQSQTENKVSVLVREAEVPENTVVINTTEESFLFQYVSDSKLTISDNEHEAPVIPNIISKQSDFSIPGDSHKEEENSQLSPVVQKRKMGSTRRPLKGNKGQGKQREESKVKNRDNEAGSEEENTETHSKDQEQNVAKDNMNIIDNVNEEKKATKALDTSMQELCEQEQRSDVSQTHADTSQDETSSHLLDIPERTVDFVRESTSQPDLVLSDVLLMTEAQTYLSSEDNVMGNSSISITEVHEMHADSNTSKRKMGSTRKRGKRMVNEEEEEAENTIGSGATSSKETLTPKKLIAESSVHKPLFSSYVINEDHDSKSDVQTELSDQDYLNSTINTEPMKERESSPDVVAEMVSDFALGHVDTEVVPEQRVIPEEPHKDQANLNPVVQKRKMGSTRKTLRGNKGQRKEEESKEINEGMTQDQSRELHLASESKLGEEVQQNQSLINMTNNKEAKKPEDELDEMPSASSISQFTEASSETLSSSYLKSEKLDSKDENDYHDTCEHENAHQICADATKSLQSESVPIERRRKMGSTRKNIGREGRMQRKRDGYEDTEIIDTNLQMSHDSEMSSSGITAEEQTTEDYSNQSEDSLLGEIQRMLKTTSQSASNFELIIDEPKSNSPEGSEIRSLSPSQSLTTRNDPNSPERRRRKMGSTRKNPKRQFKAEREDEDKVDQKTESNKEEITEGSLVHNITEDPPNKEYLDVPSAHTSSQQEESDSPVVQESASPSTKRKFGSRRANKGKLGRLEASDGMTESEDGDHKPDGSAVEDRQHRDCSMACGTSVSLQPENLPFSRNYEVAPKGTGEEIQVRKQDRMTVNVKNRDSKVVQFNVVMVGNSCVGKTSFIRRFHEGQFTEDYRSTIGVDTFVQTVELPDRTVKLQIWDTAGQERFHSITTQVFHKAEGLLLMYEITCSKSFISIRDWISQARERAQDDVVMMLLGNKNDSVNREVQIQEGADLAREYNIHFMECSAANGANVSESMKTLAELLVQRKRKREEHTTLRREPQQKKSGCC